MKITRLLVLLFFGLLSSPVSQACTCVPANVQKDIERATVVFRGKLVAHSWGSAVFEVEEQFKGAATKKMKIEWRRGDRGNCNGFWPDDLVVGNELVVFAVLYRGGLSDEYLFAHGWCGESRKSA